MSGIGKLGVELTDNMLKKIAYIKIIFHAARGYNEKNHE